MRGRIQSPHRRLGVAPKRLRTALDGVRDMTPREARKDHWSRPSRRRHLARENGGEAEQAIRRTTSALEVPSPRQAPRLIDLGAEHLGHAREAFRANSCGAATANRH
jgi:hypothetical protein